MCKLAMTARIALALGAAARAAAAARCDPASGAERCARVRVFESAEACAAVDASTLTPVSEFGVTVDQIIAVDGEMEVVGCTPSVDKITLTTAICRPADINAETGACASELFTNEAASGECLDLEPGLLAVVDFDCRELGYCVPKEDLNCVQLDLLESCDEGAGVTSIGLIGDGVCRPVIGKSYQQISCEGKQGFRLKAACTEGCATCMVDAIAETGKCTEMAPDDGDGSSAFVRFLGECPAESTAAPTTAPQTAAPTAAPKSSDAPVAARAGVLAAVLALALQ